MAKPITPQEMTAYVEATWDKCKKEAWQDRDKPVAWLTDREELYFDKEDAFRNSDGFIQPLYTEPQWVGLSDDEREHFRKLGFVGVLAVENRLKEKNGG